MKRWLILLQILLACSVAVHSQVQTGQIFGTVTDSSGAVMADVKVTLSSPAILQPIVVTTTDSGAYQFPGIPIGTYSVKFEAPGYRSFLRENILITIGFNASVNAQLNVATVEQSIEVSGAAPVVDTQSTTQSTQLDQQSLEQLPVARSFFNMVELSPGVQDPAKDVGGAQNINQPALVSRGANPGQNRYYMDGVDVAPAGASNAWWMDYDSIQEMQITSGGGDPSVETSGLSINMVTKSGSDSFHGSAHLNEEGQRFESDNFDPALRLALSKPGTSGGNPLQHLTDWGANVGGPIMKGRLWFWGGFSEQIITLGGDKVYKTTPECAPVAANQLNYSWGTVRECTFSIPTYLKFFTYKIGWSPFHNNTFTFENAYGFKGTRNVGLTPLVDITATRDNANFYPPDVGAFRTFTGLRFWNTGWTPLWKFADQQIINDHWMIEAAFMHFTKSNGFRLLNAAALDTQIQLEQSTGQQRASAVASQIFQPMNSFKVTSNYFLPGKFGGNHTFKVGYNWVRFEQANTAVSGGGAQAIFNTSGVLPPFSTALAVNFYRPGILDAFLYQHAIWVQDTYTHKRLTLNLGLRWDRQNDSERPQQVPASRYQGQLDINGDPFNFLPAVNFPGAQAGVVWNTFAPRIGATYDLFGKGKTVLKASYAIYYDMRLAGQLSDTYNTISQGSSGNAVESSVQFPWTDLNGDKIVQMNEVNTRVIRSFANNYNPSNKGATSSPNSVDPNIKNPRTDEVVVGVSQELAPGFAVGASYIYRKATNFIWNQLNGISSSNYVPCQAIVATASPCSVTNPNTTVTTTTTLTAAQLTCPVTVAPTAPTQCSNVTYFVPNIPLPTSYTVTNQPHYYRTYQGLELSVRKIMSRRWMFNGSFTYQGNWQYWTAPDSYQDPTNVAQQNGAQYAPLLSPGGGFPINVAVNARWMLRLGGLYRLPWWDIAVSAMDDLTQGYPILNKINIPSRANQAGAIAVLIDPPGTHRLSTLHVMDLRVAKSFRFFGEKLNVEPSLDIYNLFNANTILAQQPNQNASNANFIGYVLSPRLLRLGIRASF